MNNIPLGKSHISQSESMPVRFGKASTRALGAKCYPSTRGVLQATGDQPGQRSARVCDTEGSKRVGATVANPQESVFSLSRTTHLFIEGRASDKCGEGRGGNMNTPSADTSHRTYTESLSARVRNTSMSLLRADYYPSNGGALQANNGPHSQRDSCMRRHRRQQEGRGGCGQSKEFLSLPTSMIRVHTGTAEERWYKGTTSRVLPWEAERYHGTRGVLQASNGIVSTTPICDTEDSKWGGAV